MVLRQGNACYPPQVPGVWESLPPPSSRRPTGSPGVVQAQDFAAPSIPADPALSRGPPRDGRSFAARGDPPPLRPDLVLGGSAGGEGRLATALPPFLPSRPPPPTAAPAARAPPARPAAPPALPPPPQRSLGLRRPNFSPGASPAAAAPAHGRRAAGGLTPRRWHRAPPQPRAMAARAPPAAPAAEEPGSPGGPPRRKKSRSGLRRAFSWLRGKRRKKKAAGAEGAESAAPRAKKADDKAKRAKGKGRGKVAGHLG